MLWEMAKIDHSFHMDEPPPAAQERLEDEIGWELHRDEGFVLVKDTPGELRYSDGSVDRGSDETAFPAPDGAPARLGFRDDMPLYSALREIASRRIQVELTPDRTGTLVRIHGHGEGRLRDAVERLGTPGHWPEVRLVDGSPTEDR